MRPVISWLIIAMATASALHAGDAPPAKPDAADPKAATTEAPAGGPTTLTIKGHRPLKVLTDKVTVGANLATIDLPPGCRYVPDEDARYLVHKIMGNPPNPSVLGVVLPGEGAPDDAVIIASFKDTGHVKDGDAAKTDYAELLKQMQDEVKEANPQRKKQGYATYTLNRWAETPHYDGVTHKLYWAMDLKFDDQAENTLNYNVRVLGRKGVLVLNAIGDVKDLAPVANFSKAVLDRTEFTSGNRYQDFQEGTDKVAAYGVAGLIAGGLLLKAGGFKLLAGLIKPLLIGGGLLLAVVGKLLMKRKDPRDA